VLQVRERARRACASAALLHAFEESNVLFEDRGTTALPELCERLPRPIPAGSGHLPQLHAEMGSFE